MPTRKHINWCALCSPKSENSISLKKDSDDVYRGAGAGRVCRHGRLLAKTGQRLSDGALRWGCRQPIWGTAPQPLQRAGALDALTYSRVSRVLPHAAAMLGSHPEDVQVAARYVLRWPDDGSAWALESGRSWLDFRLVPRQAGTSRAWPIPSTCRSSKGCSVSVHCRAKS